MSRFQKIFLASAIVVVGFGVAKFLGQPILPSQMIGSRSAPRLSLPVAAQTAVTNAGMPQIAGGVRLLPDSPIAHVGAPPTNATAAKSEPPRLGSTLAPVLATIDQSNNSAMPRNVEFGPISSASIGESGSLRARLRDEAPRPVGIDPQSPAAIRRLSSENVVANDPYKVANAKVAAPPWSAPQLLNTGYTESSPSPPSGMPASYTTPINSASVNQLASQAAPPPWPVPQETAKSRTHIVVDGDSLERLASRYLSDPQRGREIYELNREVLSAPDLLPIGAELKIPERVASASWDRRGLPPNSTNAIPSSAVVRENATSAWPTSTPQGIIPRAQLAPPVMVQ